MAALAGKAMEEGAGIYRNEQEMKKTCNTLRQLRERFSNIAIEDKGDVFNTQLIAALELDFMLDVAEAVAHSALNRKESRGSHTRTDFPKRDDQNFLKHTLAHRTPQGPRIEYLPVTTWAEALPRQVAWLIEATRDRDWREVLPRGAEYLKFDYDADARLPVRRSLSISLELCSVALDTQVTAANRMIAAAVLIRSS